MEHATSSPVQRHVRRPVGSCQTDRPAAKAGDQRWSLLDLVRRSRKHLGLRDRDIAVLRGLLSFIPQTAGTASLVVFASNRALIERCDGIDERTLRRRLAHLHAQGLITRKSSPNGKRYQVRDEDAVAKLTYGIDLSPLFGIRDHLNALAEQCAREELRCKALRSVIRDMLYHHADDMPAPLAERAYRSLRRALSSEQLDEIIGQLRAEVPQTRQDDDTVTVVLSVRDSQNDRHIQSSNKEIYESEGTGVETQKRDLNQAAKNTKADAGGDITITECMSLARNAASFSVAPAQDWNDVIRLSDSLAPAVGLGRPDVESARKAMGALGSALAILGIVEAFDKIRRPNAYLNALTKRASEEGIDFVRMFRSLTKGRATGATTGWAA